MIGICIGGLFAEITSQGEFNILSGNEVFYENKTLVCANSEGIEPQWTYREIQSTEGVTLIHLEFTNGISYLSINNDNQGYYTCDQMMGESTSYTVAIFNKDITIGQFSVDTMFSFELII